MFKRIFIVIAVLMIPVIGFYIVLSPEEPKLAKCEMYECVRLQLQWYDQAQFAGFYVAKKIGLYNNLGLEVEIISGGPDTQPLLRLPRHADIGLHTGDAILINNSETKKSGKEPVIPIGTVFNGSVAEFISKGDSGIITPTDFAGKKVGAFIGFDSERILRILLKKHNLEESEVTIVPFPTLESLWKGDVDVYPAYSFNETIIAMEKDAKLNVIKPKVHGVSFYSDTLFTSKHYYETKKDVLDRFIRASQDGWRWADRNREAAVNIVYELGGNLSQEQFAHQRAQLDKALESMREDKTFKMDKRTWLSMASALAEIDALNGVKPTELVDQLLATQ